MLCNRSNPHAGHICVADEHYVATLLSAYKMKDTFDRIGILAFTDWKSDGGWHPKSFYPGDSMQAIYTMRSRAGPAGCVFCDAGQRPDVPACVFTSATFLWPGCTWLSVAMPAQGHPGTLLVGAEQLLHVLVTGLLLPVQV